jgi:hypothetical protein
MRSEFPGPARQLPGVRGTSRQFSSGRANEIKRIGVGHCLREAGAGGSNPLTPTSIFLGTPWLLPLFRWRSTAAKAKRLANSRHVLTRL